MNNDYSFNKDDVIKLAEAILECPIVGNMGDRNPFGYYCEYCDNEYIDRKPQENRDNFIHKLDCPVLIAKDILTNLKEN